MGEVENVTFFGKEVKHPALQALVVGGVLLHLITFSPLYIPVHFLLRKVGRNGFYFNNRIIIEKESFARR